MRDAGLDVTAVPLHTLGTRGPSITESPVETVPALRPPLASRVRVAADRDIDVDRVVLDARPVAVHDATDRARNPRLYDSSGFAWTCV